MDTPLYRLDKKLNAVLRSGNAGKQGLWKRYCFLSYATCGVISLQWKRGSHVSGVLPKQLLCGQRSLQAYDPQSKMGWSECCSDVCETSLGRTIPRCSYSAHLLALVGARMGGLRGNILLLEAVIRCWHEFCWVLLNRCQGALYWKRRLSIEIHYLALVTQGHCKCIFFPQDCWLQKFVLPCTSLSVRDLKCCSHGVIRQSQWVFVAGAAANPCCQAV